MALNKKEREMREEAERKRKRKLAQEITDDFLRRREERRGLESGWLLNLNFTSGNQYCDVSPLGGIEEEDKRFYWQSRRVFNHIAPTVDSRLAKLEKMKPQLTVKPFSDEEGDVKAAQLSTGILKYVRERICLSETLSKGLVWSEICGTAFYKVVWDEKGGRRVAERDGQPVYEGEVAVTAISPFEIFPDRLDIEDFDGLRSVIHAQVVSPEYILRRFGVRVKGEKISELSAYSAPTSAKQVLPFGKNSVSVEEGVVLLERYSAPTYEYPDGRLEIVAANELLYEGELPYTNGRRGERGFPFVKQESMRFPGAFFGGSVVDRLVPVQRAYNAVRNRKHEFLNRLSMGVLTVEDGAVDADELSEEGLLPGKVLVYRQGAKAPEMLDCGDIPSEFKDEEEWLQKEFSRISGVSDLSQSSTPARVTSATGLQLLLAQDESRLSATVSCFDRAVKEIGRQVLQLYRQFGGNARMMTLTGENKRAQAYYFNASKLDANDILFESHEAVTPEEKRMVLMELYDAGILTEEDGRISKENRQRILEAFGFDGYENTRDISALHTAKAVEENLRLRKNEVEVDEYDDHELHEVEHTRYLLSEEFKKSRDGEMKKRFVAHLRAHKERKEEKI